MSKFSLNFWDLMAKRYSKSPVSDEATYQKKLQITREYFKPDMKVFEFGCGTGSTAIAHAPYVKHILAIDGSSKMIEIAQDKAKTENIENITFEQASIESFDMPDETYDVAMGHSILHLLKNKDYAIAKAYKMLKPGGVFVSSTICLGEKFNILQIILPIGSFIGILPLIRFFSKEDLKKSMTGAGFLIEHEWQPQGKGKAVFLVAKKPV